MRLLLTSVGVTNNSIRKALVELPGKPVEECQAVQIITALYAPPSGPEDAYFSEARMPRRDRTRSISVTGELGVEQVLHAVELLSEAC